MCTRGCVAFPGVRDYHRKPQTPSKGQPKDAMKRILLVSTEKHSGKSLLALALGRTLQERAHSIAYMKPISFEVSYTTGEPIDRDADAIRSLLGLGDDLRDVAPVPLGDRSCARRSNRATGASETGSAKRSHASRRGGTSRSSRDATTSASASAQG